jgi:Na+-exporting ATPase
MFSSFPAFGLGREPASRDVMRKPPQDKKRGVFTNQILWDMLVYGILSMLPIPSIDLGSPC